MRPAALALALAGCCTSGLSSSDCDVVIDKIIACDPTAAGTPRSALAAQCTWTSPRCVTLPTGTTEACAAFMGCLYDD